MTGRVSGEPLPATRRRRADPATRSVQSGAGSRRTLAAMLLMALLTAIGAAAWWPVYSDPAFVVAAGGAIAAGTLIGGLGASFRWPAPLVLAVTVAAWLLLGVPLAVPAESFGGVLPTGAGLADLVVTTATGWSQLLTIELPVGDYQALLVPVFVLCLAASVLATTIAARTARPALAVIPPAVVLAAGIVFGGEQALAPVALGGAFALVLVGWLVVAGASTRPRSAAGPADMGARRAAGVRPRALSVPVIAAALGLAVIVVVVLPAPDRLVARELVPQPFQPGEYASPLSGLRAYAKEPLAEATVLSVTGAAPGTRLAVARLDDYDGLVFTAGGVTSRHSPGVVGPEARASSSDLFQRVTGRLGTPAALPSELGLHVVVGDYAGVWVPTPGLPSLIEFTGRDADLLQNSLFASPLLSTVADLEPLLSGDEYDIRAAPPAEASGAEDIGALVPGASTAAVVDAPDALAERLAEWAPDSRQPGERLSGIVAGLRSGYVSSGLPGEVFSRSGHGTDRLQQLLTETPMVGDAEQYAAAGALFARAAGFPARVAMGFVVPDDAGDGDAVALRGRDATAWIEVYAEGQGWTAIDVTPEPRPIPETALDDTSAAVPPPEVVPPPSDELDDPVDSAPLQQNDDEPRPEGDGVADLLRVVAVVGLSLAVLAVLVAPFLTVLGLKARRRARRRQRGSARSRAAGSWAEVVDVARDRGTAPPPSATRREAAAALSSPGTTALAARVDAALYSPEPPSDQELRDLWASSDAERHRLLAGERLVARMRARLSLRSLRR